MTTIGETVSRVRNVIKSVKEDPFMTDRFIYSVINKYAKMLIKRQDDLSRIIKFESLFRVLPCVELIEVDKVEACCGSIKSNCRIMRTKEKLPLILEGSYGPLFRSVSSIDGSIQFIKTYPNIYSSMSKTTSFKYNKNKYYWYLNNHLYFPDVEWESIRIEAIWEGDISMFTCESEDACQIYQDRQLSIPEYLLGEIEQLTLKEILGGAVVASDGSDDKQNILR